MTRTKCGLLGLAFTLLGFALVFLAGWTQHQIPFYAWYRDPVDLSFFLLAIGSWVCGAFLLIGCAVWADY